MAGQLGYLAERVRSFRLIKSAVAEKLEAEKGSHSFRRMYVADFLNWIIVAGYQLAASLFPSYSSSSCSSSADSSCKRVSSPSAT